LGAPLRTPQACEPFLSVVVTTRNDDHGGDPLKRLQAFVNVFGEQCRRTGLDAELIVVEWNPPADRPRVESALRVPDSLSCIYRFIEVPPDEHQKLQYADVLPLFQMIAKNVGIRRARGQFVLATNIDIIFSNELIEYIAARRLCAGRLYRVDRHDIESAFPVEASLAVQMEYCQSHQLRVHERWGSYPVDSLGRKISLAEDIVDGRTVRLGRGWHVREGGNGKRCYRWASDRVELFVDDDAAGLNGRAVLDVEITSNPYDPDSWVEIVAASGERQLAAVRVEGQARFAIPLDLSQADGDQCVELQVADVHANWNRLPALERRDALRYRVFSARLRVPSAADQEMLRYPATGWANANRSSQVRLTLASDGLTVTTDPLPLSWAVQFGPLCAPESCLYRFQVMCAVIEGGVSFGVLSGDRTAWIPSAVNRLARAEPPRFEIAVDLEKGQRFWLVTSNAHPDGAGISKFKVQALMGSSSPSLTVIDGSATPLRRILRWWHSKKSRAADAIRARIATALDPPTCSKVMRYSPEFGAIVNGWQALTQQLNQLMPLRDLNDFDRFLKEWRPGSLHGNACGDFQLMAREHWEELRGYPEFETFSMSIDGLFSYIADAAGVKEEVLQMPIYHLEHEKGSGWSPEGEALLRRRIAERGITWLDASTVRIWAAYMRWLRHPMIFNGPDWGLSAVELPEHVAAAPCRTVS
jgi:hypothetical protein